VIGWHASRMLPAPVGNFEPLARLAGGQVPALADGAGRPAGRAPRLGCARRIRIAPAACCPTAAATVHGGSDCGVGVGEVFELLAI